MLRPSALRQFGVAAVSIAAVLALSSTTVASAQSIPGSSGDIGSINSMAGSVDPSSAGATAGAIGSAGSADSASLTGSGTLPQLGTGSQNTLATPPIPMESTPVEKTEVRKKDIGDPRVSNGDPRFERWWIASKSMNRVLPVEIWRAAGNSPASMLYLLDGVDSPSPSGWLVPGNVQNIFAGRNVTLVMPTRADGSLHADWVNDDPILSRNKWQTFLTKELPPLLEAGEIPFSGKRGIAGLSMGAGSAVEIAERSPQMFEAVGAIAGCYTPNTDIGFLLTKITVETRGGNVANLWGQRGSKGYTDHDAVAGAEALRGKALYLASATGVPDAGEWDRNNRDLLRFTQGTAIEIATYACTGQMDKRLKQLNIPAQVDYLPTGLHNWDNFARFMVPMRDALLPRLGA